MSQAWTRLSPRLCWVTQRWQVLRVARRETQRNTAGKSKRLLSILFTRLQLPVQALRRAGPSPAPLGLRSPLGACARRHPRLPTPSTGGTASFLARVRSGSHWSTLDGRRRGRRPALYSAYKRASPAASCARTSTASSWATIGTRARFSWRFTWASLAAFPRRLRTTNWSTPHLVDFPHRQ